MSEDFLGFGDDADRRAAQGPAFIAPAKMGGHELTLMARIHVDGASEEFIGKVHSWVTKGGPDGGTHRHYDTSRQIFTTCNDEVTGEPIEERWAMGTDPETRQRISEGERWRIIMGWPVGTEPTPDDAMQFMANGQARLRAKWWPQLQEARAKDEAAARGEGEIG